MTPLLVARGLGKRFGGIPAVVDVDLEIAAGEVVALIGPNGAGKSTLLGLLNGTITADAVGALCIDGESVAGRAPHRIRHLGIATVLQSPRAFTRLSVFDNVMVGALFGARTPPRRGEAEDRSRAALDVVGLARHAQASVGRLTLHQRRSLDLARAIAGGPRILLLDEVMAGLNPVEVDLHTGILRQIRDEQEVAIIWVEHVMRAVKALADRIVVLDAGRVIASGPPDVVVDHPDVVAAYLGRRGGDHAAG